ncbi:MAG: hypothetical protein AAF432_09295 [Planctomycetota bacterium]
MSASSASIDGSGCTLRIQSLLIAAIAVLVCIVPTQADTSTSTSKSDPVADDLRSYFDDWETQGTGLGPCCFDDGTCDDIPPPICLIVGGNPASIIGEGSCFVPGTCAQPGACCLPTGLCTPGAEADGEDCVAMGGVYAGPDTTCSTTVCPFPQCPSGGSCFVENGTEGCNDTSCCNLVCNTDPFCCAVEWDLTCANLATAQCDTPSACGLPDAGDCGANNGTPGCNDLNCCSAVCAKDPFCCETQWDLMCISEAVATCGIPTGACCFGSSCDVLTPEFCTSVGGIFIGIDAGCFPSTCTGACCLLDGTCVTTTAPGCAGFFQGSDSNCLTTACPEPGACCLPSGACFQDSSVLGDDCNAAGGLYQGPDTACGFVACPNDACPGQGACLVGGFTPGCQNEACCGTVCSLDSFCCNVEWDDICAADARDTPACTIQRFPACATLAGLCTSANGTPGCSDFDCCTTVCEADPFCCDTEWDAICVANAAQTIECGYTGSACCAPDGTCIEGFGFAGCESIGGTLLLETSCELAGCVPCPWDCTPAPFGNGVVNVDDLVKAITAFGSSDPDCDNAPINGDGTFGNGVINIDDVIGIINMFGDCP